MNREISVRQNSDNQQNFDFAVNIDKHKYSVSVRRDYWVQITDEKISPKELVRKSFEFLLEREGPESILKEFELPLINDYFPDYEQTIRKQL